ncbi:MAG TPA: hypothetical protein VK989_21065 [Polyangia bacterium]|jgi:hypothetical protein|nr:hypothetical protein [Polyangia bacterium]
MKARRQYPGDRSTKAAAPARGALSLLLALAACDGRALETGGAVDAGVDGDPPTSLTIPAFVGPPVLSCDRGGVVELESPCQLGRAPLFEVDCAYGPRLDQVIRFELPASIFLPVGLPVGVDPSEQAVPLGVPLTFDATLLPTFAKLSASGEDFQLTRMNGTLTLTKGSLAARVFDGWFSHLDFVWTSGGDTMTCTLDDGRFSTIPGAYE